MMPLHEVDLLGVYVTPAAVCLVAAIVVSLALRRLLDRTPINHYVWNRALFDFSMLVAIAALMVLSLRYGGL